MKSVDRSIDDESFVFTQFSNTEKAFARRVFSIAIEEVRVQIEDTFVLYVFNYPLIANLILLSIEVKGSFGSKNCPSRV